MKQTKNIPTLKNDGFKTIMSYYDPEEYSKKNINDFYIHGLSDNTYELKMPLLSHRQTNHSIIFITKGSIASASGIEEYIVGANTMIVIPAGQITSLTFMSADVEGFYLHFSSQYLSQSNTDLSDWLMRPIIEFEQAESNQLVMLLNRMQKLNESEANAYLIKLYLTTLLGEMTQSIDFKLRMNFPAHERITMEFKKLLNYHATKNNAVRFYATELNVTPNHLNKCVKAALGFPASALINEMLVLEAKILLQKNNISVNDVAFETGFEDVSYFGRFFKKHTGLSPTEYRKMIE